MGTSVNRTIWDRSLYDCRTYMEDIVVDDENAIYVTGSIVTTGAQNGFLMKLSDTGLVQWQQHWAYPDVSYTNVGYKVDSMTITIQ